MYPFVPFKQYKWVYEVNKGYVNKSGKQDRRYFMLREDYEYLKQFESNFNTAIKSNYTRNIVESKLKRMVEIYEKETGRKQAICLRCGSVVVSFLKDVGKLYFSVQEGFENNMIDNELDEKVTNKADKGRQKAVKGVRKNSTQTKNVTNTCKTGTAKK